ncbi:MAG TPA: hypothetical protein DDZ76_14420 [Xanthomonadales bacterium]|nr:hypothetical protein [Xanthomonadales bacterium]
MLESDLELSFRTRRPAYVVDPMLALASPHGAQLTSRLSSVADLWVTRTFWQVIDASEYYRSDPLALWPEEVREGMPESAAEDFRQALALWEEVRQRTDLSHCRLNWVSDSLTESAFPDGTAPDLLERYERLHQGLTGRCDPRDEATGSAWFFGAIDTLSLTAALGRARALTLAPEVPGACFGLACERVGFAIEVPPMSAAAITAIERRRTRELLVSAGCAPLLWSGLRLAVVHPVLSGDVLLKTEAREGEFVGCFTDGDGFDPFDPDERGAPVVDPWKSARGFCHGI